MTKSIEEHLSDFIDAMRAAGCEPTGDIEGDGKLHRFHVKGDKRGTVNGWYILHLDERPAGKFGSNKDQITHRWSAKGLAPLSEEERAEMAERRKRDKEASERAEAERHAAAAAAAAAMWEAAAEVTDHPYLTRKGVRSYGLRAGDWIKSRPDGSTYVGARNALLIPIRDARGMVSLQAIFAAPVTVGEAKRDKDFVYGGKKRGCWFSIGRPTDIDGRMTVIICEGYATGASIHYWTGIGVVVAFDAGNLLPVAEEVRRLMPEARIVFAADNDQWTERPMPNPGVFRANEAAEAVDGEVVVVTFSDLSKRPTDFNDLEALEGGEEVQRQLMAVLKPPVEDPLQAPAADAVDPDRAAGEYAPPVTGAEQNGDDRPADDDDLVDTDGYFRILGHDADSIFVYQYEKRMITQRGETDWSENAMITLAPIHWWEMHFPGGGKDGGFNRKAAFNWLVRTAYKRGFFDPSSRRGRGAWRDDGRLVYHFGNKLWIDGNMVPVTEISSSYVYEQARRLRHPSDTALSGDDGRKIIESAKLFHWTRPASALLLCGYVALAPICGALGWRPHIWLTGGAGSGKTTILKEWLWPLMNGCCVFAQGNSTEAGIRQTLKSDSLPVLFDESEQNDEREAQRVQGVLAMIRQSSTESEARTLKGTAGGEAQDFMIRSMFCLSSIQVGINHQADYERISVLALQPKREGEDGDKTAAENWAKLSAMLADLRADVDLPGRLMRRSLQLLPITLKNIAVFSRAAAEAFGSQRDGDQYGALIAGAWSLFSAEEATLEQAKALIAKYEWGDYRENTETEESTKALNALLGRLIRFKGAEISVYELIEKVALPNVSDLALSEAEADKVLRRHGMMVRGKGANGHLLVSNRSYALNALMAGTAYAADLRGQLLRVPEAERHDSTEYFAGERSKAVSLPLYNVLNGLERPGAKEPPPSDLVDDNIAF